MRHRLSALPPPSSHQYVSFSKTDLLITLYDSTLQSLFFACPVFFSLRVFATRHSMVLFLFKCPVSIIRPKIHERRGLALFIALAPDPELVLECSRRTRVTSKRMKMDHIPPPILRWGENQVKMRSKSCQNKGEKQRHGNDTKNKSA